MTQVSLDDAQKLKAMADTSKTRAQAVSEATIRTLRDENAHLRAQADSLQRQRDAAVHELDALRTRAAGMAAQADAKQLFARDRVETARRREREVLEMKHAGRVRELELALHHKDQALQQARVCMHLCLYVCVGAGARVGAAPQEPSAATGACVYASMFCLLYTSPSPRDQRGSRMPSSA